MRMNQQLVYDRVSERYCTYLGLSIRIIFGSKNGLSLLLLMLLAGACVIYIV